MFALLLEQHLAHLTYRCLFEYVLLRWRSHACFLARDVPVLFSVCLGCCSVFGFVSTIEFDSSDLQFLYFYLLMVALYWKGLLMVISGDGVVYELDVVVPTFSREWMALLGCLFF